MATYVEVLVQATRPSRDNYKAVEWAAVEEELGFRSRPIGSV